LSPAKVSRVEIIEETKTALVIDPDNQLSLAIGREGQNARLAAKLTGWRIDIKSDTQIREIEAKKLFVDLPVEQGGTVQPTEPQIPVQAQAADVETAVEAQPATEVAPAAEAQPVVEAQAPVDAHTPDEQTSVDQDAPAAEPAPADVQAAAEADANGQQRVDEEKDEGKPEAEAELVESESDA
ncbi:MAG: hypothetical protein ACREN5_16555, partial [Gemmatimonadales bacterium]